MNSISSFFANAAFVQMLMCGLLLAPNWRANRVVKMFILLMACGCGYLLASLFGPLERLEGLWWLHYVAINALPGIFWLTALSIFSDSADLWPWKYIIAGLTLLIPLASTLFEIAAGFDLAQLPALDGLITYGAMTLELVLISHAIVVATKHWRADLVQERRYMRGAIIGLIAAYLFVVIVLEQVMGIASTGLDTAKYIVLTILMVAIYRLLFTLRRDSVFASAQEAVSAAHRPGKAPSAEVQRILDAMNNDCLYREEGMTISRLSRHLSIHEYKLRQLINGELGYRNFNDFLNHYRTNEVAKKLGDPEFHSITILSLALESGFRSLSSFNRAFRSYHGMTPTEYRNRAGFGDSHTVS
ncbi:MAG: helix-turn-helix domain-containing protein [Wenzhouxiangellaceae bacterium]